MSKNSKIEWTDHTFNPWEGCTKVGPGCDHCYAENRNARFAGGTAINWGAGAPRRRTSEANWRKPIAWNKAHAAFFAKHGRRQRVFCASLADVFDNEVPAQWRIELMRLIIDTPNLDWLLLTKRIGNAAEMLERAFRAVHVGREGWADNVPPNVWIGATIVNQAEAARDIPKLLATPAAVRFLSMEPLLGPVDLRDIDGAVDSWSETIPPTSDSLAGAKKLDWVIVGGESGPNARPMHPDWARSLRDQCEETGTPFLFKQWGEWAPGENANGPVLRTERTANWWGGEWDFSTITPRQSEGMHRDDAPLLYRLGKKTAGRHLDGELHDGFPRLENA